MKEFINMTFGNLKMVWNPKNFKKISQIFKNLKNRKKFQVQNKNNEIENLHLASFVISMNDDYETRREEKLEYPLLSLVADVGGTAGLVAGMSIGEAAFYARALI